MSPIRLAQILLTLTALEFFGPIVRDINATHALNPIGWGTPACT
jgi:hypothetical protein